MNNNTMAYFKTQISYPMGGEGRRKTDLDNSGWLPMLATFYS